MQKFRDIKEYLAYYNRYPEMSCGDSLMYLCPLHEDHTASMHVTIDEMGGKWYCFGCSTGGTLQKLIFLMEGYQEKDWHKVYDIIAGRESLAAKPAILPPKKKRTTQPADDLQRGILSFLTLWWHDRIFDPTYQAKQARAYLTMKRGVSNRVQQSPLIGYAPGDSDGSYCITLAKHIVSRFGYHGLQAAIKLGIFREDEQTRELSLRLQYRVMFSCLDPQDQRTAYYQGRIVEPYPSQYPKIGPTGLTRVPFWIPILEPAIEGTIGVEAAMGVATLAHHQIPSLATLGEGLNSEWLKYFSPPFFWAQDNDEPKPVRGGIMISPGEKQAQKCIEVCRALGYPAYRLEPPRFAPKENGIDDWTKRQGIGPIYDKIDEVLGVIPSQELRMIV